MLLSIFTPFFSTRDVDKGAGLGLSMVYGFVTESGGNIRVESELGEGTLFSMYFPKTKNSVADNTPDAEPKAIPKADAEKTILVVEDEPDIRDITCGFLAEAGYKTLVAANGQNALNIIQDNPYVIDLVFTDIAMPGGMNGVEMAIGPQVLRQDIKLLFTTGYADESMADMHLIKDYPTLNKPYQPEELIETISKTLNAKRLDSA